MTLFMNGCLYAPDPLLVIRATILAMLGGSFAAIALRLLPIAMISPASQASDSDSTSIHSLQIASKHSGQSP